MRQDVSAVFHDKNLRNKNYLFQDKFKMDNFNHLHNCQKPGLLDHQPRTLSHIDDTDVF